MNEKPTPETDVFITSQDYSPTGHQWRNFTRKLERERDESREAFKIVYNERVQMELERNEARSELSLKQQTLTIAEGTLSDLRKQRDEWSAMCGRYKQERDELLQKLDAWKEIAELLHHFVNYPANGVEQAIQRVEVLEAFKHLSNEKTKRR